jgi:adenylate cyclase
MDDPADFASQGLLDGLEGVAREERAELLRWLREEHRASDAELARATANGTVVLVAASRSLGTGARYSAREVAEQAGVDVDLFLALNRAGGLPAPADLDAPQYGEMNLEATRTARRFLEAGLLPEQMLSTSRVLGRGLSQTAELMRQNVMELAAAPGRSEKELAETYAAVAQQLVPMVGPLVEQMLRVHLDHAVREEVVTAAEREAGELPGAREVCVAFADLVGFTRLGEELPPDELERVAGRLSTITNEVVGAPVRFVKSVGDAVLLVSSDDLALLRASFDLLAAVEAEGPDFPQLRIGAARGAAVSRAGDWFGRPVNLASRITTVARAGSVVADPVLRKAVGDDAGVQWSSVGERKLKGVPGPVRLYRARAQDPPSDA